MKFKVSIVIIAAFLGGLLLCLYTVDETEQVVITEFGRPVGEPIKAPGLQFKWPWRKATFFAKNLLEWDGDPGQIPTLDKTFIWVDTFGRWKIVDPLLFFQTVTNQDGAQARLDDILDAAVRNFITSYPLIESVRRTDRVLESPARDPARPGRGVMSAWSRWAGKRSPGGSWSRPSPSWESSASSWWTSRSSGSITWNRYRNPFTAG